MILSIMGVFRLFKRMSRLGLGINVVDVVVWIRCFIFLVIVFWRDLVYGGS